MAQSNNVNRVIEQLQATKESFAERLAAIIISQNELLQNRQLKKQKLIAAQRRVPDTDPSTSTNDAKSTRDTDSLVDSSNSIGSASDSNIHAQASTVTLDAEALARDEEKYAFIALEQALRVVNQRLAANWSEDEQAIKDIILNNINDLLFPGEPLASEETLVQEGLARDYKITVSNERKALLRKELPNLFHHLLITKDDDYSQMLTGRIARFNIHKNYTPSRYDADEITVADQESLGDKITALEVKQFNRLKRTFEHMLHNPHLSYFKDMLNSLPKNILEVDVRAMGAEGIDPDLHAILIALLKNDKKDDRKGTQVIKNLYDTFFKDKEPSIKNIHHFITQLLVMNLTEERRIFKANKETKRHKTAFAVAVNRLSERYEHKLRYEILRDEEGKDIDIVIAPRNDMSSSKFIAHEQKVHLRRVGHIISALVGVGSGVLTFAAVLGLTAIGAVAIPVAIVPVLAIMALISGTFINYLLFDSFYVPFSIRAFNKGFFTEEGVLRHIYQHFVGKNIFQKIGLTIFYALVGALIITSPIIMFVATLMSFVGSFGMIMPIIVGAVAMATFIAYVAASYESIINFPGAIKNLCSSAIDFVFGNKEENWHAAKVLGRFLLVAIPAIITVIPAMLMVAFSCYATALSFSKNASDFIAKLGLSSKATNQAAAALTMVSIAPMTAMPGGTVLGIAQNCIPTSEETIAAESPVENHGQGLISQEHLHLTDTPQDELYHAYGENGYDKIFVTLGNWFSYAMMFINAGGNSALAGPTVVGMATGGLTSVMCGTLGIQNVAADAVRQNPAIDVAAVTEDFNLFQSFKAGSNAKNVYSMTALTDHYSPKTLNL